MFPTFIRRSPRSEPLDASPDHLHHSGGHSFPSPPSESPGLLPSDSHWQDSPIAQPRNELRGQSPPQQSHHVLSRGEATLVLHSAIDESFINSLRRVLAESSGSQAIVWTDAGCSFVVIDVEAFKRHVLAPYFNELPFAHFVRMLNEFGFRTTIKTIHYRHMSATSDGWVFSHPLFTRTGTPKLMSSDIISFSDFEPGIEISPQVGHLLAKAQDETSALRREVDRLRGHGSPHLGASPRSQSPHSTASFLGKDNDEQTSLFQPDPIVTAGIQSPHGANSPLPPLQSEYPQQVDFHHYNHPDVAIHPPTPAPMSPHEGPVSETMFEMSPDYPFTVPNFQSPSGSHCQTLRDKQHGYSSPGSGPHSTPSSEPSSSRSPSRVRLSPLTQSLSLGNDADNFEKLDESLSRAGMAGDVPEYLDSNLASPDLADPEAVQEIVRDIVDITVGALPTHLIHTGDGKLYERSALRSHFEGSDVYMHLVGILTTKSLVEKRDFIEEVIRTYFQYAMLSHKWELPNEALFPDLSNGVFFHNPPPVRFSKLRNFCQVVQCRGLAWAWCDTCCINKDSTAELDEAIRSMFRWYRDSALTIVYLSDVVGFAYQDLVKSKWFKRGWTLQELLAPRVVRFYDKTWTPCVRGPEYNHKLVPQWLDLLEKATGIPVVALQEFVPGTKNPRERLRWASSRSTTRVEDLGYCLFGIFDVALQPQYGEGEKAFWRLLLELIRTTQDTGLLDWVGKHIDRSTLFPLNPSGFREKPLTIEGSKSSAAPSPAVSSGGGSPASGQPKSTSWLWATGEGILDVWCYLHTVKESFRVSLGGPDVQRVGNDNVVQYVIRAENLKDFKIVVSLNDALENVTFSRTPFVVARPWEPTMNEQPSDKGSIISWKPRERDSFLMQPFCAMLLVKDLDGRGYSRIPTETRIIAQLVKQPRDYHPTVLRLS